MTERAASTTLPNVTPTPEDLLFGRLALHYKLVTREALLEATSYQAGEASSRRLGEILVEKGHLTDYQLQQLLTVQRDYLVKQPLAAEGAPTAGGPVEAAAGDGGTASSGAAAAAGPARPFQDARLALGEEPGALPRLLEAAFHLGVSDVHLHSGAPLLVRAHGRLRAPGTEPLAASQVSRAVAEVLSGEQLAELEKRGQIDFAYSMPGVGRFRANAYRQQRGLDAVFRVIPAQPPTLQQLGLPTSLARFANFHQGIVLLTGPAGCGKSSTLAALVNIINQERPDHIVTIEDPIEYIHTSQRCIVNQRQVGRHTGSFARALRAALREDPDIIAIGELRDLETISLALTAAETGHLVLASLHTSSAIRTVNRILGVFPPEQQDQIRTMVSESLRAIVSQKLVARADGEGRVPALEILVANKAIANLIRENKTFQIRSVLQTGGALGMCMLDASLAELVKKGVVTREEALHHADDPQKFAA